MSDESREHERLGTRLGMQGGKRPREEAQGRGPGRRLLKRVSCYLEVAVEEWTPLVCDLPNGTSAQEDLACK